MRDSERSYTGQRKPGGFNGQNNYTQRNDAPKKKTRIINNDNYVEEAENVILEMKKRKDEGKRGAEITTSKLRNLLAMAADIYNEVMHQNKDALSEEVKSRIEYLRVRFMYEAGRDDGVKTLVEEADLIEVLKNIKGSKKNYILFNRYMEALVAFHRYHGGKDN